MLFFLLSIAKASQQLMNSQLFEDEVYEKFVEALDDAKEPKSREIATNLTALREDNPELRRTLLTEAMALANIN